MKQTTPMNRGLFGMLAAAVASMPHQLRMMGQRTLADMGMADESPYVPTSRNGGRRKLGNRHVQRMARKIKNVRRFRRANRG